MDIDQLNMQHFAPLVKQPFQCDLGDDATLTLELVSVETNERIQASGQEHFTLTFSGPADQALYQGTHHLTHAELGSFSLFLVPIDLEDGRYFYEAVFSRLNKKK